MSRRATHVVKLVIRLVAFIGLSTFTAFTSGLIPAAELPAFVLILGLSAILDLELLPLFIDVGDIALVLIAAFSFFLFDSYFAPGIGPV